MNKIYYILALCFLAGCVSTEDIYKKYDNLVPIVNGVNIQQAKIIAQRVLIDTEEKDSYRISYPDIKTSPIALKYPDYWFVVFGHNLLEPLSNDALHQNLNQLLETEYLVVINKETGKVLFFGEWYPKRENDFDWVFDMHAYNRKDLLALPPWKQGTIIK